MPQAKESAMRTFFCFVFSVALVSCGGSSVVDEDPLSPAKPDSVPLSSSTSSGNGITVGASTTTSQIVETTVTVATAPVTSTTAPVTSTTPQTPPPATTTTTTTPEIITLEPGESPQYGFVTVEPGTT